MTQADEPVRPSDDSAAEVPEVTPEMLAAATCSQCGASPSPFVTMSEENVLQFWCPNCVAPEARNMSLVLSVYEALRVSGCQNGEGLSVLAIVMHMIAANTGDNLDALQEGLRQAQGKFQTLFPQMVRAEEPPT